MPGFHIEHFGCRAARADGELIAANLLALASRQPFAADIVVVNTCSVTAEADRAARAFIRKAHRDNPAAKIVVTGCYAQRAPGELASLAGVAVVVGNSHKALLPAIVSDLALAAAQPAPPAAALVPVASLRTGLADSAPVWADDRFAHSFLEDASPDQIPFASRAQTRPNLKIQEGCSNRCSFCVIPFTRGPSRSLPAASVFRQVDSFVAAGGNELVLSGINLGRWGSDLAPAPGEPCTLAALVRAIFDRTALLRLRLSSIEPMDWNHDLIGLMRDFATPRSQPSRTISPEPAHSRFARHAHLPLQSGCDAVLRRMHRRYRPWHYADKVASLVRAAGPDLTLGADVMAGFPGETDREFDETLAFIRELPFGYLHLFPFSPRPGTPGFALHSASPIPASLLTERMAVLRALAAEKTLEHRGRFIGRRLSVLTLHAPPTLAAHGRTAALSDNFLPVELDGIFPANQLLHVHIAGLNSQGDLAAHKDP